MAQLISARLPDSTADRVRKMAKRKQRSVNETVQMALEEWLRQDEFAWIEFRDTRDGRAAFMKGSRLPVYAVIKVARACEFDLSRIQAYWPNRPRAWVQAALNYFEAYPEEIETLIELDCSARSFDALHRRLPQLEPYPVPGEVLAEA